MIEETLWANTMLAEVEAFDETLFAPTDPVAANEKIVGEVTESFLRKTYSLLRFYRRECEQSRVELNYIANDSPDRQRLLERAVLTHKRADVLVELFWLCVREKFQLLAHPGTVGIRQGWIVVLAPESQNELPIFRHLFGL